LAKLLGDLRDKYPELSNGAPIHHRPPIGLQIHVLSHADVEEWTSWLESEGERPMEVMAGSLTANAADDVIGSAFEVMRIDPAHAPGSMLSRLTLDEQILLH